MTTAAEELEHDEERWERNLRRLALAVLGLSTLVVSVETVMDHHVRETRTLVIACLVVVTAAWMWWWRLADAERANSARAARIHYLGRTLFAAALTLLHPLFCIFAWVGYLDIGCLPKRWRWAGVGATAVIMACGQVGSVPWDQPWQAPLFGALLVINFTLAMTIVRYSSQMAGTSERRAETIAELERALSENARLHDQLLHQERETGVRQERERLAAEIHDTLAQSLAGVLTQLEALRAGGTDSRQRLDRAITLTREALAEARRSVQDLAPAPLAGGRLTDALETLTSGWDGAAKLVVTGDVRPLHPEVEATLLRVAQEALANAAKHAHADRVGVTLSYAEDEVILDVRDDGAGFDTRQPAGPSSFGLRGMRQRAERLAGVLDIESEPGGGTAVSVRLPALDRGAA